MINRACAKSTPIEMQDKKLISIGEARQRRTPIDWTTTRIDTPEFLGRRVISTQSLDELVPYIDWSPVLSYLGTTRTISRIFSMTRKSENKPGNCLRTRKNCSRILSKESCSPLKGVYGFWPANSIGDDIELYTDESRSEVLTTFHMLRQQMAKPADQYNHSLADYIAPQDSGRRGLSGSIRGDGWTWRRRIGETI